MIPAWFALLRRPFDRSREHFVSVDARRLSDPKNYEMLTPTPHQYHMGQGPTGLIAIPAENTPQDRDLSDSSEGPDSFEKERSPVRSASINYSYPKPPSRSASDTQGSRGHIREDLEVPPSPAEEVWPSPNRDRAISPSTGRRVGWKDSVETPRSGSALGVERPSPILERQRSGSALGRERDASPRHPYARTASPATTPLHRPNPRANAGLANDWDPRSTFARGTRPGGALTPDPSRFSPEPDPVHIRMARSERQA
jgi:hypothetical protein